MLQIILLASILLALFIIRFAAGSLESPQKLKTAHTQSIGNREIQSDVFDWSMKRFGTLFVVADGIGTETKGRTAALAATDSIVRTFELADNFVNPSYFFRQAFRNANEAVLRYIPDGTAGASVLCVLIRQGMLYYALVGNCRISILRRKELIQLSEGQTFDVLVKNAFKRNEICRDEAKTVYNKRSVYNYIGKDNFKDLEMFDVPVKLKRKDCIVLMSDGIYEFLPHLDLVRILNRRTDNENKVRSIIAFLERKNDPQSDNATIVLSSVNRV
jgi:serine/threonine protein phosphatase PrpC